MPANPGLNISKFDWRVIMWIATLAMLLQQAFSYVCQMVMPVLADRLAEDFAISRGWLGLYLFIQNLVAIVAAIGCGGFILRYGPLRVSQGALLLMCASLIILATGILWLYPLAAILLGVSSVSTPASSHILARVVPPHLAPLIFSVKQTGVPVGSLIGGLLIPFLLGLVFYSATAGTTIRLGPYGAALVTALIVVMVAVVLQPLREYFDRDRQAQVKISISDLPATVRLVLGNYPLRDLAFAAFAFGGLQSIFSGFFILFLIDGLNYTEIQAGSIYAIASFSAIWARILWGAMGERLVPTRWIMSGIGLFGAVAAILVSNLDSSWSVTQITLVAVLYNITALSWHGILLAETARLAPPDKVGGVTGGVLAFTSIAMMIYPAVYGLLLAQSGSYRFGYTLGAVPALLAFLIFIKKPIEGPWLLWLTGLAAGLLRPSLLIKALVVLGLGTAVGLVLSR